MPVLARPGYRRLWAARTVSQCGDIAQFTAVALLVFHLTGSGLGVSGVVIAEIVAVLLLAPLAGPVVDRLPRVTVIVGADLARAVLAGVLAVWHGDIAVVYVVAVGLSAGSVFFNPAAGSLLPALVNDDELLAANSAIWSAAVLSQVLIEQDFRAVIEREPDELGHCTPPRKRSSCYSHSPVAEWVHLGPIRMCHSLAVPWDGRRCRPGCSIVGSTAHGGSIGRLTVRYHFLRP